MALPRLNNGLSVVTTIDEESLKQLSTINLQGFDATIRDFTAKFDLQARGRQNLDKINMIMDTEKTGILSGSVVVQLELLNTNLKGWFEKLLVSNDGIDKTMTSLYGELAKSIRWEKEQKQQEEFTKNGKGGTGTGEHEEDSGSGKKGKKPAKPKSKGGKVPIKNLLDVGQGTLIGSGIGSFFGALLNPGRGLGNLLKGSLRMATHPLGMAALAIGSSVFTALQDPEIWQPDASTSSNVKRTVVDVLAGKGDGLSLGTTLGAAGMGAMLGMKGGIWGMVGGAIIAGMGSIVAQAIGPEKLTAWLDNRAKDFVDFGQIFGYFEEPLEKLHAERAKIEENLKINQEELDTVTGKIKNLNDQIIDARKSGDPILADELTKTRNELLEYQEMLVDKINDAKNEIERISFREMLAGEKGVWNKIGGALEWWTGFDLPDVAHKLQESSDKQSAKDKEEHNKMEKSNLLGQAAYALSVGDDKGFQNLRSQLMDKFQLDIGNMSGQEIVQLMEEIHNSRETGKKNKGDKSDQFLKRMKEVWGLDSPDTEKTPTPAPVKKPKPITIERPTLKDGERYNPYYGKGGFKNQPMVIPNPTPLPPIPLLSPDIKDRTKTLFGEQKEQNMSRMQSVPQSPIVNSPSNVSTVNNTSVNNRSTNITPMSPINPYLGSNYMRGE